jgi:NADH-ubiquinone oxidoreductase chain 2
MCSTLNLNYKKMLVTFLLIFIFSNGLTIRSDSSVLYSRLGIIVIFYSLVAAITSFHITYLDQGIPMYGGLFTITSLTQSIQIFILILCGIILTITGFFPRKKRSDKKELDSLTKLFKGKIIQYTNIINKMAGQFTIIEYALIILFVITGATFFITSADLGSIYICIELQSFSLYILAAMYRNSELGTGASLTYFLLGGLSSCFILLAIATIYSNTGVTNIDGVYSIVSDYIKFINISM